MKILQIVPSVSLVYGGPSQMIRGLSMALAQAGADVTLLTTDSNGDTLGDRPLDVPLAQAVPTEGYTTFYFRCWPFRRYKFSPDLLGWLGRHGTRFEIAHIHALFSPLSTAAATVARLQGLPYVLRPLGTLDPADLQKKELLKKIYGRILEGPNLAGAAAVHFTSVQEATISERYGAKTQDWVIPLGVTESTVAPASGEMRKELGLYPQRPLILYMSRLDPKKGLDLLLPALATLAAEKLDFQFVLAGSNPQDRAYEKYIQEAFSQNQILRDRVKVMGFVQGRQKEGLLKDADLFVLPSYYENFGIAVAEALVAGTPVVISDQVDIHPEVRAYDAGWISRCEVPDLCIQLRAALSESTEWPTKSDNARRLAKEKYTWGAIAARMLTAYEDVLKQSSAPL
ncbi:MAG: hormogonium polysaccharide biosynthesis glycosyltransferase HpsP [Cyanobacteria bacterium P01_H01_bin.15]